MDLLKLFDPNYLFDSIPGSDFPSRAWVYLFFIVLFGIGLLLPRLLKKRPQAKLEDEFFGGLPHRFREFAVLGLIFTFFRDQNIPYLGMRVWMIAVILVFLGYLIYVWRNYQKNFAKLLVKRQSTKSEDKYKPKKKRK